MTRFVLKSRSGIFRWSVFFLEKADVLTAGTFMHKIPVPVIDKKTKKLGWTCIMLARRLETSGFVAWRKVYMENSLRAKGLRAKQRASCLYVTWQRDWQDTRPSSQSLIQQLRSRCLQAPISQSVGTAH